eukprot:1143875-Pelagomonas_calceolata.AAC.7
MSPFTSSTTILCRRMRKASASWNIMQITWCELLARIDAGAVGYDAGVQLCSGHLCRTSTAQGAKTDQDRTAYSACTHNLFGCSVCG